MLLPESFPIFYSLGLVIFFSSIISFWRFFVFKRKLLQDLYSLPSIVVLGTKGSGKSSFIRMLTNSSLISHPVQNGLNFSTLRIGDKKIQLVEIPYFADSVISHLKEFRGMNVLGGFYIFDVSKDTLPIEEQLENFKIVKEFLKKSLIPVANKVDIADGEKIEKLKSLGEKVYMISLLDVSKKKELEDIMTLMKGLSSELVKEKSILT